MITNSEKQVPRDWLILFFFLLSCNSPEAPPPIAIIWEEGMAVGIFIPRQLTDMLAPGSLANVLTVHLMNGENQPAIPGEYRFSASGVVFAPPVAFTRRLKYEVRIVNQHLAMFAIAGADEDHASAVDIYPSKDTLPENILRFYLVFSGPMDKGWSPDQITLVENDTDTLRDVFRNPDVELWNADRTRLTLWLDPKPRGTGLSVGNAYRLLLLDSWQDRQGAQIENIYTKNFVATNRDSTPPDPGQWVIEVPRAGSSDALRIDFSAPLDYTLLLEAISVHDEAENPVAGKTESAIHESVLIFQPARPWAAGRYSLKIGRRLEDPAGNKATNVSGDARPSKAEMETFQREFILR